MLKGPKQPGKPGRVAFSFLAVLSLGMWVSCAGEDPQSSRPGPEPSALQEANESPVPVGAEVYDRLLSEAAGEAWTGEQLAALARDRLEALEAELDALAAELPTEPSWREAFGELRARHPNDASEVLESYRREIRRAYDHLTERGWITLPEDGPDGVTVNEIQNPVFRRYFSLAMYMEGRLGITLEASNEATQGSDDPGSYLRNHCNVCIGPLAVHEIFPGHHLAYRRAMEEIPDAGKRRDVNRAQVVFHEGWALYVEQLMLEDGFYPSVEERIGALRMIYLRALRAWIDPRLHGGEIGSEEAARLYRERGMMTAGAARSEVDRHLKDPVLKASYFLGAEQIRRLRERWRRTHPEAPLRDFHDTFLGYPAPVPEVALRRFQIEESPVVAE